MKYCIQEIRISSFIKFHANFSKLKFDVLQGKNFPIIYLITEKKHSTSSVVPDQGFLALLINLH